MRILLTGTAGMLGRSLVPTLVRAGHQVVATDKDMREPFPWGVDGPRLAALDVRRESDITEAFGSCRPQLVIHLAAETSLEVCEGDTDEAFRTNAIGTKLVALACRRYNLPMVYISTAGIFDGLKEGAYTEFDTPNPINAYGHSKLEGEHYVEQLVPNHYIVRAGWMVGGGVKDHKFVSRILDQVREGSRTIYAVADKWGTPTYANDFSRCLTNLIETGSWGTYHMVSNGHATRFNVARHILDVLGRDDIELVEVDSSFFAEEFFAPRPKSEIMRNLVLDLQGMNTMRPWRIAIEDYLKTEFRDMLLLDLTAAELATSPSV